MQSSPIPKKLLNAKINPIDWPKVPEFVEDCLIAAVMNACTIHGDNQYESSKSIKLQLQSVLGGNWTVIICPKEEKTYNIHYTPVLISNQGYQYYDFTFESEGRRYLIFRAA